MKLDQKVWLIVPFITKQEYSPLARLLVASAPHLGMSKKSAPWIPTGNTHNERLWGEDFAPAGNGDGDFKYSHVKRGGDRDYYPHIRRYPL